MKTHLVLTLAIILLISLVSCSVPVDSYSNVDQYNPSPRRKHCLHKKIIRGKCLKFKKFKVCAHHSKITKCVKFKKFCKCIKLGKPKRKCIKFGFRRTKCADRRGWSTCDQYGTRRICTKKAFHHYCAKRTFIPKCVKHGERKVCRKYKKVPIRKCETKKICDSYSKSVDSYQPQKCKHVKKCKIVSFAKKCVKFRKIKFCKLRILLKKCLQIRKNSYCAQFKCKKVCKHKRRFFQCVRFHKEKYCSQQQHFPPKCLKRKVYKKCIRKIEKKICKIWKQKKICKKYQKKRICLKRKPFQISK
ncbi:predicted protein [Naegleria gruberi]|uniref:Predicted protein n=1 Tax=Naegleria gruberi TaxID=5762 RepID=D2VF04_NAEGR|nr:uncharacterized protein NAEGRDRAFT_67458 [Naegleria gruberi]EFC44692.1 predicted protein [Naegleria gruberi]|eukprot:XP_002677436.1 predicted protein [Naegleria gruberi strain NEG-M]